MDLESLRRGRRILGAAVALASIALVMARMRGPGSGGDGVGLIASVAFVVCLALLVVVWRKEYAASEAAFAARAEQQLALMRVQADLAKKKGARAESPRQPGAD